MSEAKKEEDGEAEAPAAAKPKSKKMLFIIVGAVALLVIVGAVVMLMGGKKEAPKEGEKRAEVEKHLLTAELPPVIVNLSDTSSYLKVTMLIEYDSAVIARAEAAEAGGGKGGGHGGGASGGEEGGEKAGGLPGPLAKREPMIKDAVIRVLSSKKVEELLTTEGKEKLKEELVEAINEASGLEEGAVVNLYFTEFIIQ